MGHIKSLHVKLDGSAIAWTTERGIVVMGWKTIVDEDQKILFLQGVCAILQTGFWHEQIDIQHHAVAGIVVEARHEMRGSLEENRENSYSLEHGRDLANLEPDALIALAIEDRHALQVIRDIAWQQLGHSVRMCGSEHRGCNQALARHFDEAGPVQRTRQGQLMEYFTLRIGQMFGQTAAKKSICFGSAHAKKSS